MTLTVTWIAWCIVQVTLFSLAAGVVYLVGRKLSPATGATLLTGTLGAVLALTLLAASPWPRWEWDATAATPPSEPAPVASPTEQGGPAAAAQPATPPDASQGLASVSAAAWQAFKAALTTPGEAAPPDKAGASHNAASAAWWAIGVCLAASGARFAWGLHQVRGLLRRSRRLDDRRVAGAVSRLREQLKLETDVELRESSEMVTAATMGWRCRHIVLPKAWRQWSDDELHAVLGHELSHVAAQDYRSWLIARFAVAVHFYHPLVRWLANRLQLEQELAADASAAELMGSRGHYLQCLASLALATPQHRLAGPARTLIPSRSLLMRRVEMLRSARVLSPVGSASPWRRGACAALVAIAAVLVAGVRQPVATVAAEPTASDATATATHAERLPLSLVPADAVYAASVRPAELLADPAYDELASILNKAPPLKASQVSVRDVAEALFAVRGGRARGPRIALRFGSPEACLKFVNAMLARPGWEEPIRAEGPWQNADERVSRLDESTLVFDQFDYRPDGGPADAKSLPPLRAHVLQLWAPQWEQQRDRPLVAAFSVAALRQELTPDERQGLFGGGLGLTLSPLVDDVDWIVASGTLGEQLAMNAVVQCRSDEGAAQVAKLAQALMTLGGNALQMFQSQANAELAKLPPEQLAEKQPLTDNLYEIGERFFADASLATSGEQVTLAFQSDVLTASDAAFTAKLVLPAVQASRAAAMRTSSMNNLRQLALAMHNYHDTYGHLPPPAVYKAGSKHPHSWRVALLPFLEQQALYDMYQFDEPWDSEANRKVAATVIPIYRSPFDETGSVNTSYFALTGPDTVFPDGKGMEFAQIRDGTSATVMLVEAKRDVPWTKPEDIPYAADKPLPELGGWMPGIFQAAYCDGSVRLSSDDVDSDVLRAMITADGGERIELP